MSDTPKPRDGIEKRVQRDGSIRWRARVRLLGHPHLSKTFTRKTDAKAWIRKIKADGERGAFLPDREAAKRTVASMIDRYISHTLPTKPRNRDAKKVSALLAWWRKRIGHVFLYSVTPKLIAQCRDELVAMPTRLKNPRSAATVNRSLAAISACFSAAVADWHWIEASPMGGKKVRRLREADGIVRYLSDDERARLLTACRASWAPWLFPLVLMALATGGRRGELLGLKWRDVDLNRGAVTFLITKNAERRTVPVAGVALDALRAWAGADLVADQLVFEGPDPGKPVYIEQAWREALAAANVEEFRFHDLRHSAASYLAMSGATAPEIAAVLGHKTLQMVKRYAHLGEQHTAAVVSRMTDKFLKG